MKSALSPFTSSAVAWSQRAVAYSTAVWVVAEGNATGWAFLLPIAALVAVLDARASGWRVWRVRPLAAARFAAFFIVQSARAGVDVALRALHPRLPINPDLTVYPLRLRDPSSRVLLANAVSLLPGTLSVQLDADTLQLHVLDAGMRAEPALRELEQRIAALHGVALDARGDA